jgi:hypothetical protein
MHLLYLIRITEISVIFVYDSSLENATEYQVSNVSVSATEQPCHSNKVRFVLYFLDVSMRSGALVEEHSVIRSRSVFVSILTSLLIMLQLTFRLAACGAKATGFVSHLHIAWIYGLG